MSRASRRFYRSLTLSLVALGVLVWVVLDQFEVPRQEVLALVLGSLALVAATIVFAAVISGLWVVARKWRRKGDSQ